jgi:hypothetical protein
MSLLQKYGALVVRGGKVAMAAAMECINKCCAKYVCAYRSATDDPDEGQDCYPKGTEPGTVLGEYGSEKECLKYCETQYVCAYRDSETPAERDCYPSTDDDPNLIVLSEHDTKKECEEDCGATYVCAYRSIDPAKDRFCSKKTDPVDPELIVLAEYDSLKQCEDNCDEGYVCAYPVDGSDADRACRKDDGDPSFVILTEHGSLKECEEFCYEGKYVCAYKSEDPDKGRSCYKATDDDPTLIVLSEHNSLAECEYACVDETGACCLYKCEYNCTKTSCEQVWSYWEKDATGACVEVTKETSDGEEIWASNGCEVFKTTDTDADISLCDDTDSSDWQWSLVGSSKDKCEAVEEEYYECLDGYTEIECEEEAERRAVYHRWSAGEKCADISCDCSRYGCVLTATDTYECVPREDIVDPGLVLSWHGTLDECNRECDPEVGACCIRDCDCSPGACVQTHVYFYEPANGAGCIGVVKETSDDEEIWITDGCDVYSTSDTGALGGEPFLEVCPDNKDGWKVIGYSLEKCRGVFQEAVCNDGYTEEQCREEAERLGAAYTWTGGAKCDDVLCTCLVWVCKGTTNPLVPCDEPKYGCVEVYAPQGDEDYWNTEEECNKGCGESICSYEYPNDYSCHPLGADVSGFTVPTALCSMVCCGPCANCHTLNDELQFANSEAGGGANGWQISTSNCFAYSAYKPVDTGSASACFGVQNSDQHGGDWLEGSIHFKPCNSPFIGAYNRVPDPPHPPILPGFAWRPNYKEIPLPVDDCEGDGCDCNWADYKAALRYEAAGVRIGILRTTAATSRSTLVDGSSCSPVEEGGLADTYSTRIRYRAFVYDCAANKWEDVSDCLLKRTEMEYYFQGIGGPLAVPPDPEYIDPLEPGLICTPPPENPFP